MVRENKDNHKGSTTGEVSQNQGIYYVTATLHEIRALL